MKWAFSLVTIVAIGAGIQAGDRSGEVPRARTHLVEMRNFAFSPARLELSLGDTVVWVNQDAAPHTATDSLGRWGSEELAPSARWSHVATETGRVPYVCEYHPPMRGELVVRAVEQRGDG